MNVFDYLQINDSRERAVVGLADAALRAITWPFRAGRIEGAYGIPARVLVLRLERIGDLLMVFDALVALRASLPSAHIDLVVGSWNEPLARAMAVADQVETLDGPWLARDAKGANWPAMVARSRAWRARRYDLAVNFEPDIRSNLLIGLAGPRRRVGYFTGGGGACLTDAAAYDPSRHTRDNALRLVQLACPGSPMAGLGGADAAARLAIPESARARALALLGPHDGRRFIGVHASGGRAVKQWHLDRFAAVATALGREYDATVVLTGTPTDAALVRSVRQAIPLEVRVIDASADLDLLSLGAVLERCAVFVTGDTGPMHVAAAVHTPTVAIFGPSDPARYRPLTQRHGVVRIDLPCSPCNRIRMPPERCRGHVPDCLDGISVEQVFAAAAAVLRPAPDA